MARFLLGINYWPRSSAMYMWQRFDIAEIRNDMARIRALGFDIVRFFLMWEAFAPQHDRIDERAMRNFDAMMSAIADAGLLAMPTLFCGHMSGVNWVPAWALDSSQPHGRFRTIAAGEFSPYGIGDFYRDDVLIAAQVLLARAIGEHASGNPILYAWDLGNEFSNMREPHEPMDAASWSALLTEELLEASGAGTTAGIHGEDLERDRRIRPSSLAEPLQLATMHGYSVYSIFSRGRLDTQVVPFLCALVQSFSRKPLLFTEFGNPQCASHPRDPKNVTDAPLAQKAIECLDEEEMVQYAEAVLAHLLRQGAIGAMWWCWADYDPSLAALPPFDRAPHELRFGIVRADGSEKPVAHALSRFAREKPVVMETPAPLVAEDAYYASLPQGVFDLYRDYCRAHD
jgi:endo-1,4-beta-mannosidase